MNAALVVAGVLAVAAGIFHIYAGARRIFPGIEADNLPGGVPTKQMLRGVWQFWAVSWWSAAALFFLLADGHLDSDGQAAVRVVAATFALYAVVIAAAFRGRHPGWPAFSVIAIAAWWGTL